MRTVLFPEWLIDGSGAPAKTNQAVVVSGNEIESVVTSDAVPLQVDDRVIQLPGMTLVPGLINNHVHLVLPGDRTPFMSVNNFSEAALTLRAVRNSQTALRSGVTTVRDVGGRGTIAMEVRDAQAQAQVGGARVIAGGWPLTISGGHLRNFGGEADGEDGVKQMVRRVVSAGVDFVKVMASGGGTPGSLAHFPSFSVAELRVIVETAHGLGRRVVAHCTAAAALENAVSAGVDFIEHAMFLRPDQSNRYDPRVGELVARSGIPVTPTLQVFRDLVDLMPPGPDLARRQAMHDANREAVSQLRTLGVPLLAGSDAGWLATPFGTFWKELDELVICGLTPVEAICAASGRISRAWGYHQFGAVQAGQLADLVVVDGNVAGNIRCLSQVKAVFQSGAIAHSTLAMQAVPVSPG